MSRTPTTRRRPGSLWWLRLAMFGLTAVLAVVFLAQGFVLIGVLLALLTVARLVFFTKLARRRREWSAQ